MRRIWRTLILVTGLIALGGMFLYVMMRSGPLAPVAVTVAEVRDGSLSPALFGVGLVESGAVFRVGPTTPGRVKELLVQVGDWVEKGQKIAVMDPVDMDERISAQKASIARISASVRAASARMAEIGAKKDYAEAQSKRYDNLLKSDAVSIDAAEAKRQERLATAAAWSSASAELQAARADLERAKADLAALVSQKENLDIVTPAAGLVSARSAEPGVTVVAGQPVAEIVDMGSIRISVRFDQAMAGGLRAGLPAQISLRSGNGAVHEGKVLRVEPVADPITEEMVAKAVFHSLPDPVPPVGELAEVTVNLPPLPEGPVVPDGALKRHSGRLGVWVLEGNAITFRPVKAGRRDLEGNVQITVGLEAGERVVVHSMKALTDKSRVKVFQSLEGVKP